jgi:hypothetical protein
MWTLQRWHSFYRTSLKNLDEYNYWLYEKELQYFAVVVLSVTLFAFKIKSGLILTLIRQLLIVDFVIEKDIMILQQ